LANMNQSIVVKLRGESRSGPTQGNVVRVPMEVPKFEAKRNKMRPQLIFMRSSSDDSGIKGNETASESMSDSHASVPQSALSAVDSLDAAISSLVCGMCCSATPEFEARGAKLVRPDPNTTPTVEVDFDGKNSRIVGGEDQWDKGSLISIVPSGKRRTAGFCWSRLRFDAWKKSIRMTDVHVGRKSAAMATDSPELVAGKAEEKSKLRRKADRKQMGEMVETAPEPIPEYKSSAGNPLRLLLCRKEKENPEYEEEYKQEESRYVCDQEMNHREGDMNILTIRMHRIPTECLETY
jgi:hypothetical protein